MSTMKPPPHTLEQGRMKTSSISPWPQGSREMVRGTYFPFFLWGIVYLAGGVMGGGLWGLQLQLKNVWESEVNQYRWIVLTEGSALQVDEVGRLLRKMPGIGTVHFLSPEAILEQLKKESVNSVDMGDFKPHEVPASWEVFWDEGEINFKKQKDILDEVLEFPGVTDVAYEPRQIGRIKTFRRHWLELRLVISGLIFLGVLGGLIVVGRFLFFGSWKGFSWRTMLLCGAIDLCCWSVGVQAARLIYPGISSSLFFMGLLGGVFHYLIQFSTPRLRVCS